MLELSIFKGFDTVKVISPLSPNAIGADLVLGQRNRKQMTLVAPVWLFGNSSHTGGLFSSCASIKHRLRSSVLFNPLSRAALMVSYESTATESWLGSAADPVPLQITIITSLSGLTSLRCLIAKGQI